MAFRTARCTSKARLDGQCAIITGANTGIGKWTAKDFFERGARVIMACRNIEKAEDAVIDIKNQCGSKKNLGELVVMPLNLSSFSSVRSFAKEVESERCINLLINNAGVMMCPFSKTEDGFEMQFGTNHLGHFLLTLLILPKIISSKPARIINVSSVAHKSLKNADFTDFNWEKTQYSPIKAYQLSKLANLLFTKALASKLRENNIEGVTTYCVHPGVVKTELGRHLNSTYFNGLKFLIRYTLGWFFKTPVEGAQTTIHCAVNEEIAQETGLYYADCKLAEASEVSNDETAINNLWDLSCKLVGFDDVDEIFKNHG